MSQRCGRAGKIHYRPLSGTVAYGHLSRSGVYRRLAVVGRTEVQATNELATTQPTLPHEEASGLSLKNWVRATHPLCARATLHRGRSRREQQSSRRQRGGPLVR